MHAARATLASVAAKLGANMLDMDRRGLVCRFEPASGLVTARV
jgi:hypothetical protein